MGKPGGWKFPIIVFDYPAPDSENMVVDGSKQSITHTVTIECHSRTRRQANQLAEEIQHILVTTAQSELRKACLHGPEDIAIAPTESDFIGGNKYYTKSVEFNFVRFD